MDIKDIKKRITELKPRDLAEEELFREMLIMGNRPGKGISKMYEGILF